MAFKWSKDLLLEELEGDLCDDALEHPAGLLVEGHDFRPSLCLCCRFGWQLSLKDAAEKRNPWSHFAWLEQVRGNFNLNQTDQTKGEVLPKKGMGYSPGRI